jgi:hypothetical protein
LTSLNLSSNNLEAEGAKIVAEALQVTRPNYVIAVILAPFPCRSDHLVKLLLLYCYPQDMGALKTLDFSKNSLTRGALIAGMGGNSNHHYETDMTGMATLLGVRNSSLPHTYFVAGIAAVAVAVKDMGALTSLNLSSNNLKAEGGKIVAEAIKVTTNAMAVVLAPFSCPSDDHWLNCCCLLLSTG